MSKEKPASTEPMYQCSVCTRNKYNGDKSCPLNLDGGNSDIFDGMNRVINSCGCGAFIDTRARGPVTQQAPAVSSEPMYLYPEKYKEFGLTVGLCACVQENNGIPEKNCEYCYGTGIFVYTNKEVPAPSNCPHWFKDEIHANGFRCALYRDTRALGTVAQQAPAIPTLHKEAIHCDCMGCKNEVAEHDATLLAQEREKWERERDQALPVETCPICDIAASCDHRFGANGYPPCVQRAATQAREDVLKQIDKVLSEKYDKSDLYDCGYRGGAITG